MGQMQHEIKILNEQRQLYLDGKIDTEKFKQVISATRATKEWLTECRKNLEAASQINGFAKKMAKIEMMGSEAIDLSMDEKEREMIRCPNTGELTSRAFCLSYSGDNHEKCLNCDHREETVKRLLPDL